MASLQVREYIARRVHVSPDAIRVTPPVTPDFPRPLAQTGNEKHTSDLLRSADQYRLSIEADPTVPVLYAHAQAPSARAAAVLANAAVDGLRDYLAAVAASERVAPSRQVRVEQLGRARGGVINDGAGVQLALLVFLGVFGLSFGLLRFVERRKHRSTAAGHPEADLPSVKPAEPWAAGPQAERRPVRTPPDEPRPVRTPPAERDAVGPWLDFGSAGLAADRDEPRAGRAGSSNPAAAGNGSPRREDTAGGTHVEIADRDGRSGSGQA
jgi:hypothetical protein